MICGHTVHFFQSAGAMRRISTVAAVCSFVSVLLLAGCSILPADGPQGSTVRAGQQDPLGLQYAPVPLTAKVLDVLAKNLLRINATFVDRSPPRDIKFGVGDIVSVTIFESVAGGLFIPAEGGARPGNFITLPNQQVDSKGNISVPYAGDIRALGRTQVEVQRAIVDALKDRAIEPQVVVSLTDQRTSMISVLGDVTSPARFPASQGGEHILDAITRAGGPKNQGYDEWVMLERDGKRGMAPFGALIYEPANNIYVHPNDTLYLYREPQTFVAFGAVGGAQAQINFDAWRLSLAEAVGKFGGLSDGIADPAAVFLYRGESRQVATLLGIDCSKFDGPIIPVIYEINFRDPAGYFLASRFEMRNKDVVFVSNAISVEITKAITLFRNVVGGANDPIVAATNAYALKAAIMGASGSTTVVNVPTAVP
jgi:polysaccharide export outer membrane protein